MEKKFVLGSATILTGTVLVGLSYILLVSKDKISIKDDSNLERRVFLLEEEVKYLKNNKKTNFNPAYQNISDENDRYDKLSKEVKELTERLNKAFDDSEKLNKELAAIKKPEPVENGEILKFVSLAENDLISTPKLRDKYLNLYSDPENVKRLEFEVNRYLSTVPVHNRETYKKSMVKVVYESLTTKKDVDNEKDPMLKQIKETKKRLAFQQGLEKARAGVDLTSPKED